MADELDDDFALSAAGSRSPSPAAEGVAIGGSGSEGSEVGEPDFEDDDGGEVPSSSKKQQPEMTDKERLENKKRKRKEHDKKRKAKRNEERAQEVEVGGAATQPPDMQADYLRKTLRKCKAFEKLSEMEMDELALREDMLLDCTSFGRDRSIEKLSSFVQQLTPKLAPGLSKASPSALKPGHPALLMLTGNAMRAADLARGLRPLLPASAASKDARPKKKAKTEGSGEKKKKPTATDDDEDDDEGKPTVGKLFARHFKLAQHKTWLQTHACPLAVGTPQRIYDLLEPASEGAAAALDLSALQLIVLDFSWRDAKQMNVLEGADTREGATKLLTCEAVRKALRNGAKVVIY